MRRLAITALLALAGAPVEGAELVRAPYLQLLRPDSVDVLWTLADDGERLPATVRFREAGGDAWRTSGERAGIECPEPLLAGESCYRVRLDGLAPDTDHVYEVLVGESVIGEPAEQRFRTPPPEGEGVVHLAVLGDSGSRPPGGRPRQDDVALQIERLAERSPLHGIIHTGDMDYHSTFETFAFDAVIFEPYRSLMSSTCLYATRGNHDSHYPLDRLFTPPGHASEHGLSYSFDLGAAHFVFVDTTLGFDPGQPGEQALEWLCDDLAAARARDTRWIVIVTHEPLFTIGGQVTESIITREALAPIIDRFRVDLVLSGDDHNYQRSHQLTLRMAPEECGPLEPFACPAAECYDIVGDESRRHFDHAEGSLYIVTGGGGRALYGESFWFINPRTATFEHVDKRFSSVFNSIHHAVELFVSPVMLLGRAVDFNGREIDHFSLSRLRLLRGDMDFDGELAINDAVALLRALFLGDPAECLAAGSTDGDRLVEIDDAVLILNHLFLGGPEPAAPYPACDRLPEGMPDNAGGVLCRRSGC